ncbi:MAG: hypothetical protein JNM18_05495 [Planctomycetaceae bacterium]|nr:hypothetical protein [Planctomycetaceae bacterium]
MKTIHRLMSLAIVGLGCLTLVAPGRAAVIGKATQGAPAIKSIEVLGFADDGTLLIGDGRGSQVVAVALTESSEPAAPTTKLDNIKGLVGQRLGTNADGVELTDLAVHPKSGRIYLAVQRKDDKSSAIVTIDATGKLAELRLDNVSYAIISLAGKSPVSRITDVAWADDRLVAAAASNEEFASKIFVARGPLNDGAKGELHSAETYHVAHRKWETRAPMSVIMPYRESGKTYVVGAFACTPVVKYSLDALEPEANVKGESMIELGSGNRPLDMFSYTKDGKEYVLSNTFRFHHERKPFGPSPYWTVRFERGLLDDKEKVNEKATLRLTGYEPATNRITMIDAYHGVMQMDRLGTDRVAVLRAADGGRVDFEILPLP